MLLRYCCFSSHLDVVEEKSDYRDLNRGPKCSQPKTLKPLLCRCPVVVGCRVPLQYPLISDNVSSLRCAYGRRTFARRFRVRLREFGICGFVVSTRGEASAACCQTRAETLPRNLRCGGERLVDCGLSYRFWGPPCLRQNWQCNTD